MSYKRNLKVGDKVICMYFNTPENRFYGAFWNAEILEIDIMRQKHSVKVKKEDGYEVWLAFKEIKGTIA